LAKNRSGYHCCSRRQGDFIVDQESEVILLLYHCWSIKKSVQLREITCPMMMTNQQDDKDDHDFDKDYK
jgi:hypothetical protein